MSIFGNAVFPARGGGGGGGSAVIQPLSVTANGTYAAPAGVDGYSPVTVNVPGGGGSVNWRDTLSVNWDFSNPVNTRGSSSYGSSSLIYTLDGWQLQGGRLSFVTGGIRLERYAAGTQGYFMQRYRSTITSAMRGRQLTLSGLVDGVLGYNTFTIPPSSSSEGTWIYIEDVVFRVFNYGQEVAVTIDIGTDMEEHVIQAIKLEAGNTQTLATQVNGVWVLNNSMDADTEYIKARNSTVYNS